MYSYLIKYFKNCYKNFRTKNHAKFDYKVILAKKNNYLCANGKK